MISKQMIVGDSTEEKIAKYFQSKGYWAYILPKKIGGQPFDIIACRGKDTWFIDAKHLEEKKRLLILSESNRTKRHQCNMQRVLRKCKIWALLSFGIESQTCYTICLMINIENTKDKVRNQ